MSRKIVSMASVLIVSRSITKIKNNKFKAQDNHKNEIKIIYL
jgi:hypothetical protein